MSLKDGAPQPLPPAKDRRIIGRRAFLRGAVGVLGGAALVGCDVPPAPTSTARAQEASTEPPSAPTAPPEPTAALPTAAPDTPTAVPPTTAPASPTAAPSPEATSAITPTAAKFEVDLGQIGSLTVKEASSSYAATLGLDADQVAKSLSPEKRQTSDGKEFYVAKTNDNTYLNGTPLFIGVRNGDKISWTSDTKVLAGLRNIGLGTLMKGALFSNRKYSEAIRAHFDTSLIDYQLQWSILEVEQGKIDFKQADNVINFAERNNSSIIGQALAFGQTAPKWLKDGKYTKDEYTDLLRNHIQIVMGQYKGRIGTWVVVNEAHWDGAYDFWKSKLGDGYVDMAFQAAREADPSAQLLYSDFQNETESAPKAKFNLQLTDRLKAKGLIDGVAFHMRIDGSKPPKKDELIKGMRKYGLPVYITELDVDMTTVEGTQQERFTAQAKIYETIMQAAIESGVCKSFTMFGIGDKYSWLVTDKNKPNSAATLFDDDLNPKPAFYALRRALANSAAA